ncbi:MAG: hypothetical protein R2747_08290 [Pyrinomonadaceae bacterium]
MMRKLIRVLVGLFIGTAMFLGFGGGGGGSQPLAPGGASAEFVSDGQIDCATATDNQIIKAIFDKMYRKRSLSSQIERLKLEYKDGTVNVTGTLYGGEENLKRLNKYITRIKCVKKVVYQDFTWHTGNIPPVKPCPEGTKNCRGKCIPVDQGCPVGCGPKQQPCGDVCIDENEFCPRGGTGNNGNN